MVVKKIRQRTRIIYALLAIDYSAGHSDIHLGRTLILREALEYSSPPVPASNNLTVISSL